MTVRRTKFQENGAFTQIKRLKNGSPEPGSDLLIQKRGITFREFKIRVSHWKLSNYVTSKTETIRKIKKTRKSHRSAFSPNSP